MFLRYNRKQEQRQEIIGKIKQGKKAAYAYITFLCMRFSDSVGQDCLSSGFKSLLKVEATGIGFAIWTCVKSQ